MPGVGLEDFRTSSLNAREREEMQVSEVEVALQSLPLRSEVQMQQDGGVLRPEREVDMPEAQAMSISPSGSLLAVGCRDGNVRVVKRDAWQTVYTIRTQGGSKGEDGGIIDIEPAVTSCAFRPESGRAASRNVLLVAKGCGVSHVHVTTGRQMATLEAPCNVNAVKFDELGERFAAAGVDATVRIYDEDTGQERCCLSQGDGVLTSGHSNRVYGLCWPHERPDVLLSAGWDQTVQVWDLRSGQSVRSMHGCYVCGDALDCRNDVVVTGSWRSSDPLQAWDLSKGNLLCNIPFWQRKESDTLIYAAAFGKGAAPHVILAGGSGKRPLVRLYLRSGEVVGTLETGSAVHAVEVSSNPNDPLAAICCVDKLYLLML